MDIAFWEYPALVCYLVVLLIVMGRRKRLSIGRHPEYAYYLTGIYARVGGALFLTWIYVYYYGNGDTISFFNSSVALAELAKQDPVKYMRCMLAPVSWQNYQNFFDATTGYPLGYVYYDDRTWTLVKLLSPLALLSFKSIILTSAYASTIAYGGVWRLYRMLVRYYPRIKGQLAFAVLFFPSTVFWGSGILKDTFTFSAVCWYVYALDAIFFLRKNVRANWLNVLVAAYIMIALKPYIFMTIFPASLLWLLYRRVQRIKNALLRILLLPGTMALLGGLSLLTMERLGDRLGKFSLDSALRTIVLNQTDMTRSEQYGTNYFNIGHMDATWPSVLSKFPQATFAGLFRPTILESNNVVMALAGLENAYVLLFAIYLLWRTRLVFFFTLLLKNPLLQMCFVFALGYAFMVGVSTPNFGALVRFKIPMLPMFVSGMFIAAHILDRRRRVLAAGQRFDFGAFSDGDPDRGMVRVPVQDERKKGAKPGRR